MKKVCAIVLFAALCLSATAQPASYRLNLVKGKTYSIKTTSKQAMQQSVSGQSYNIDITSSRVSTYRLLNQTNDQLDLEMRMDTVVNKISSVLMTQEINSTKPGTTPTEILQNRMGLYPLQFKIKTDGSFVGFINFQDYKSKVMLFIDSLPDSKKDAARKLAETMLKETTLRSMLEPIFAYLPAKPVQTGDTWDINYVSSAMDMSILVFNTFNLKGIENGQLLVTGTSEMESMPSADPNAPKSIIKGKATVDGTIDSTTGLFLRRMENSQMQGEVSVKNAGTEIKVDLKIDSKSEIVMTK